MADYNVTSSDGTFTVNVQTGTINNTYDIPFIGQDAINYGDDLVAAQLRQLENFSNTTEPAFGTTRVKGQLWYDSTPVTGRLNVENGAGFQKIPLDIDVVHTTGAEPIGGVKTFSSAPVFSAAGAPITVNSNTVVPNLNADFLDDLHASAFALAAQGALADTAEQALPSNTAGAGFVLSSDGPANNYTWVSLSVSAGNVQVDTGQLPAGGKILFVDNAHGSYGSGTQPPLTAAAISYVATTETLLVTNITGTTFTGTLAGNASTATTATTASNATNITINSNDGDSGAITYPVLVTANSATNQIPHVDGGQLSYNATSGALSATSFVGDGSLITNLNLSAGSHTGTLAVIRGGTGVTTSTGTGSTVRNTSPTFATEITVPKIAGSVIEIEGNNAVQIQTQNHATNTTGAQIKANDGIFYDIGMNQLPLFNNNADDILEFGHCGTMQVRTGTTARTLTLAAIGDTDFPVSGVTTVMDAGTSNEYTITEGASTILYYLSSGLGAVDTAGGCTIGPGGVATIWRSAADTYYIWGSEITP